MFYITLHIQ